MRISGKLCAWLWVMIGFTIPILAGEPETDPCADLIARLEKQCVEKLGKEELRVAIGDFPCADNGLDGVSTVSRILEDRIREVLGGSKRLHVITREHLEQLVKEKELQSSNLIDPHTIVKIDVKGVDALLDGRYVRHEGQLTVTVTLSLLNGGEQVTVTGRVPAAEVGKTAELSKDELAAFFQPQNVGSRKLNLKKLAQVNRNLDNRKIKAEIWVEGGRNHFLAGEEIRYRIRTDRDCHIAIFCHQIDGTTSQLFPNQQNQDTAIKGNEVFTIPGDKTGFKYRIGAPFGGDIVQIVACSSAAELRTVVSRLQGLRGLDVTGEVFPEHAGDGEVLWGEQHILIYTYPRW